MIELRPLIVVTGTVHVEGGETNTVQDRKATRKEGLRATVTVKREITPDRRAANVLTTDYARRLRGISILRTPFGVLVDTAKLTDVKALFADVVRKVAEYNTASRACTLTSCVVWELLKGQRAASVAGWLEAHRSDEEVAAALELLTLNERAA